MTIQLIDSATFNITTCTIPASVQDGDVMIVGISTRNGAVTTPTGWNVVYYHDAYTTEINAVYIRIADTEPASYEFSGAGYRAGVISVWRGIEATYYDYGWGANLNTAPACDQLTGYLELGFRCDAATADNPGPISGMTEIALAERASNCKVWVGYAIATYDGACPTRTAPSVAYDGFGRVTFPFVAEPENIVDATLDNMTLTGTGEVSVDGALNKSLGNMVLSADGEVDITASVTELLENASLTGVVDVHVVGSLSETLTDMTLEGVISEPPVEGLLNEVFENLTLSATGIVEIKGVLNSILDTMAGTGLTEVPIEAVLAITFENMTIQYQTGRVFGPAAQSG